MRPRPINLVRDVLRRVPVLLGAAHWLLARTPALKRRVQRRLAAAEDAAYRAWIVQHDARPDAARIAQMPPTTISIVMPVFDPREDFFRAAIASVRAQSWPHWQLCIADDCSRTPHVARILDELAADPRIAIVRRDRNGHICAASNSALALATGDYVALMDHDDILPDHALYRVAETIAAHPDTDMLYSDEDQLDDQGRRCQPAFKPDFDPDLLRSRNFVSHLGVYRRTLLQHLRFREGFEGSQDHDLALRVAETVPPSRIRHIPAVLYHWRQTGAASFSERQLAKCADASRRAVADHLGRNGIDAKAVPHPLVPAAVRVVYPLPAPAPLVSIVVPTRDRADLLARCAEGVLAKTAYPAIEFLVMDNASREPATADLLARLTRDSRVRVLRNAAKFNFAALCNEGAAAARGDVLVLLNNDVEIVRPDWLHELVAHACRPDIGAVGAKLLYPGGRIQHAGIVLGAGPDGVASHMLAGARHDAPGPGAALWLERRVGAVTAACLAVRREAYLSVGGMDAENLPVAYNDVDLCLRLRAAGLHIVWTPFAELLHHESATRGRSLPQPAEAAFMRIRWGRALGNDPSHNANLSLTALHKPGAPRSQSYATRRPKPLR